MWTGYGITVSVRVTVLKKAQVIQLRMCIEFTDAIALNLQMQLHI